MSINLLSTDLMFPSRVRGAAAARGLTLNVSMSPAALDDRLAAAPCELFIVDLSAAGVELSQLVAQAKAAKHPPRTILAVGPHVQEDKLRAAAEAGCDLVLTNGQFHAQMEEILVQYAGVRRES